MGHLLVRLKEHNEDKFGSNPPLWILSLAKSEENQIFKSSFKIIFLILSIIVNANAIPYQIKSFKNNGASWTGAIVFLGNLIFSVGPVSLTLDDF